MTRRARHSISWRIFCGQGPCRTGKPRYWPAPARARRRRTPRPRACARSRLPGDQFVKLVEQGAQRVTGDDRLAICPWHRGLPPAVPGRDRQPGAPRSRVACPDWRATAGRVRVCGAAPISFRACDQSVSRTGPGMLIHGLRMLDQYRFTPRRDSCPAQPGHSVRISACPRRTGRSASSRKLPRFGAVATSATTPCGRWPVTLHPQVTCG